MSEISREVFVDELRTVQKLLLEWAEEVDNPKVWEQKENGDYDWKPVEGVRPGLSVSQIQSIPIAQMRAELLLCSQKLEALASL